MKDYTVWKSHLFELEGEADMKVAKPIKYVVYPDESKQWYEACVWLTAPSLVD